MRITALEPEVRSGGVRVQLDERPFGTIGAADVLDLHLVVGGEIAEAVVTELVRRAEVFSARAVALRMLGTRALPSVELVRRLLRKGHVKAAAEAAVQELVAAGLLDDAAFARHYARTRAARQRFGPRRLLADLRRMGLSDRVADAAVRDALEADGVEPRAILREVAARKARSLGGLDPDTARRRLRAYLLRRGFAGADVAAVVKETVPR